MADRIEDFLASRAGQSSTDSFFQPAFVYAKVKNQRLRKSDSLKQVSQRLGLRKRSGKPIENEPSFTIASSNSFSDDFCNNGVAHETAQIHLLTNSLPQRTASPDRLTQCFAG